jgi:hypothetical protein
MKKILILCLMPLLFIIGCKKDNSKTAAPTTTVLLSNITAKYSAGVNFSYSGKQLTQFVIEYSGAISPETHAFNYNSQGQLTGTTITNSYYKYTNSVITFTTGGRISAIKFYLKGNVLDGEALFTYQNGDLVEIVNGYELSTTGPGDTSSINFTYDSNHHRLSEIINGSVTNSKTYSNFDNKSNYLQAIPYPEYFTAVYSGGFDMYTDYPYAANNASSAAISPGSINYSYQYNSYGYPSVANYQVYFSGEGNQTSDSWNLTYQEVTN